ncbi:transposase [Pasteurellaceae bacterium Phil31]|nr:transposase [Pasteurellaceae bacterium Phil31]
MSYTRLLYHIIFRTQQSVPAITEKYEEILYRYIWLFIQERHSVLYRINGMPDHLHLLVELHSTIALADFVKELKNATHLFLERHKMEFPDFYAWSKGYCALTYSQQDKQKVIDYSKNQKGYHQSLSFENEIKILLSDQEIGYRHEYLENNI